MTKLHKGIRLRAVRLDYKFKLGFILISAMPFVATVFLALNYAFPNITAREDVIRVQIILAVTGFVFLLGLSMLKSLLPQVIKVPFWAKMVEEDTSNYRIEGNWEKKDTELFDFLDEMATRLKIDLSEIHNYARNGKLPEETFKKRLSVLSTMLQVSSAINCAEAIENVLNILLEGMVRTLKLDKGILVVFDEHGKEIISRLGYSLREESLKKIEDNSWDETLKLLVEDDKVELFQDGHVKPEEASKFMKAFQFESLLVCPLFAGKRLLGEILAGRENHVNGYGKDDLRIAELFSRQATIAIENFHLHTVVHELSIIDSLTGLSNFRHFQKSLLRQIQMAQRDGLPFSMVMLDIDHFKVCNDRYGHLVGDAVLREFGGVLKENSRSEDTIARYGGEEFILILPSANQKQAIKYAERLRKIIGEHPFLLDEKYEPMYLTISAGVATSPEDGTEPQELIQKADEALYSAKGSGRNCVCASLAKSNLE